MSGDGFDWQKPVHSVPMRIVFNYEETVINAG